MLVKGLVFTAVVASTPLALVVTQDPRSADRPAAAVRADDTQRLLQEARRQAEQDAAALAAARRELAAAREELAHIRQQLDDSLDALDLTFAPQRDRNCSPSRSRALMSHYQWLRDHDHAQRAAGVLAKVVDQIGDDPRRLNSVAWSLMTDEETTGKFDEVALAFAERIEQSGEELDPRLLDTVALARFLNGQVERAVALQKQAIERGGRGDDYRRRLRTYEAAQVALAKAAAVPAAQPATFVATGGR
jgi:hypothetical protein